MSETELKEGIQTALKSLKGNDLPKSARALFRLLGYESERILKLDGDPKKFTKTFPSKTDITGTKSEKAFLASVKSIDIIFQITDEEIKASKSSKNQEFDVEKIKSFLFIAVQLNPYNYARGVYAQMAREVNKRIGIPTVVLFMNKGKATISFMDRRAGKVNPNRDVLGKVFLIRDINCEKPHRAHVDILADLSLGAYLGRIEKKKNFEGLLAVWLKILDTEELNKDFYKKLHAWYQLAVEKATFPSPKNKPTTPQDQVIRLITRILFVWFIKEKQLVSDKLFTEEQVGKLLKDFLPDGDNYYCAILQNLFFATLNTKIDERGFSKGNNSTHRNFNLYRYKNMLTDEKEFLDRMSKSPFINGGLFDCLDSEESTSAGGYRLDCFTDNTAHHKELSVPNRLFFDPDDGLFPLLDKYKFTVEENTPIEQEVALDPELLGKVFENLLAAYNPETSATAREQTGSFYTPREVVDYMVDEALLAYLGGKVAPEDGGTKLWEKRLSYLLDYADAFDDTEELFTKKEKRDISSAVADIRVLDPAVGSGAFPMGVLHKLSLVLRRVDPDNKIWEELQKIRASKRLGATVETVDPKAREAELKEISRTFETYRESDFGRKLYLIQNSIFGVDIQPIACQISKLRFFISLTIEQQATGKIKDNYGIKPLPNLETRFFSANTLLGLEKSVQKDIEESEELEKLEKELRKNRERHFNANSRKKKRDCTEEYEKLQQNMKEELRKIGLPIEQAEKFSDWKPYDQNATADWFNSKHMFGVDDGFDVVIGNPPYFQVRRGIHSKTQFPYSEGKDVGKQNTYKLFTEQSYNLCKNEGVSVMIVQSSLMGDFSSSGTRELLLNKTHLKKLIEFMKTPKSRERQVFSSVSQGTCIYQFIKHSSDDYKISISINNDNQSIGDLQFSYINKKELKKFYPKYLYFPKISKGGVSILKKIQLNKSIKPLSEFAASIRQGDINLTGSRDKFSESNTTNIKLMRGKYVARYNIKYDMANEYVTAGFADEQIEINKTNCFLISQEVTGINDVRRLHFALHQDKQKQVIWGHSVNKTLLFQEYDNKYFLALLNSKFMDWYFRITSSNNHVQNYELQDLPILIASKIDQKPFINLVDKIITAKSANPDADTDKLETKIDDLVYDLYGLTDKEIKVVESQY